MHEPAPDAEQPDWTREAMPWLSWNPSRALLRSIRSYQRWAGSRKPWCIVMRKLATLRHIFWSLASGADIPLNSRIGGGLQMPHPNGIVVHPDAVIGPNCLLFQQVTIGAGRGGTPRLGAHVEVGAGARLLGAISIGDYALIGANAVVLSDVPAGATAVGIPARIVPRKSDRSNAANLQHFMEPGSSGHGLPGCGQEPA